LDPFSQAAELERQHPHAPAEDTRGKAKNLWVLWQHRRFLWRVFWMTFVLAVIVAFALPKHYEGVAKIVPGESSSNYTGLLSRATGGASTTNIGGLDASSLLGIKTPGAFYVEVLKSRTVQDRLIDQFDLRSRYRFSRWSSPTSYYSARKKLKSFSDFDEDKKSGVITVTVIEYDPKTAADMANAYVAELNRLAADLNTSAAHREREFLEERIKLARQELAQASLDLSQFSSSNFIMDPQNQQRGMMDAVARIQGELIASETELRGLQQLYSDDNVRVRTLRARMGELEGQLRKMEGGLAGANRATAPRADGGPLPSLRTLPTLNYRYADLYRQAKIQETVYEFLTQQYEVARLQEVKELPTVRVMDRAVPPERKSGPSRILVVGLSVLGALLLASFLIIEKSRWAQLSADDPRRLLAAEVAGSLRSATGRDGTRR
jgi:uncharacterized protein involved in exopolysaccharide biosynthesis